MSPAIHKLRRVLIDQINPSLQWAEPDTFETHHLLKVLRLNEGDKVLAIDGSGKAIEAVLVRRGKTIRLEFTDHWLTAQPSEVIPLILEIAILKGEAMEWVIEKAVELGVQAIQPLLTERTVVRMQQKGETAFQERWQKIANQSLKQCERLNALEIRVPITVQELRPLSDRILCDEAAPENYPLLKKVNEWLALKDATSKQPLTITIGPEGGWSDSERLIWQTLNASSASMGPLILRAETAAISAASVFAAAFRLS